MHTRDLNAGDKAVKDRINHPDLGVRQSLLRYDTKVMSHTGEVDKLRQDLKLCAINNVIEKGARGWGERQRQIQRERHTHTEETRPHKPGENTYKSAVFVLHKHLYYTLVRYTHS